MNKLRMAVVGAGRLGGFHAQKLAARDDVELLAVVDPSLENRSRVAAECGAVAHADYAGLLDQIDAAVIAAPTCLHYTIAREFLEAGIHLLVEKTALHQPFRGRRVGLRRAAEQRRASGRPRRTVQSRLSCRHGRSL